MSQSLLGEYLQFLRSPTLTQPPKPHTCRHICNQGLRLYSVHLLLTLGVALLIGQVTEQGDNVFDDIFSEVSIGAVAVSAIVLAPLFEELVFRLPLRGKTRYVIFLSSFLFLMMLGIMQPAASQITGIFMALLGFIFCLCWKPKATQRMILRFYNRFPRLIFYSFTILFGAIHITNYDPRVWHWLPLLVLPQTIVGLLFGFMRLRYGFGWAIAAHAFHNGCLVLPVIAIEGFGSAQLRESLGQGEIEQWAPLDLFLIGLVSLYVLGGLALCVVNAIAVLRDWQKKRPAN